MQYNPEELDEILKIYTSESEEIIQELNDGFLVLEKTPQDKTPLKKLFQLAHSLKGASRMIGFNSIQDIAHKLEDILSYWGKEDVLINADMFQEIYHVCDFLLMLIRKSVAQKSDYVDKEVKVFINKLDNFITYNTMTPTCHNTEENDKFLASKSIDINAVILELMFVLEMDEKTQSIDEVLQVIKDNINSLNEIFLSTGYDDVKNKIKLLLDYINSGNSYQFKFSELKSKILDLRNSIYDLYKSLNINSGINERRHADTNKISINKIKENLTVTEIKNDDEILNKFDFVISNLQKIKYDNKIINDLIIALNEIINKKDNNAKKLLIGTQKVLELVKERDVVIDNDCYVVLLQCISLSKRIYINAENENQNSINMLLQRLNVVKDMFTIEKNELPQVVSPKTTESNPLISSTDYDALKKNLKTYDWEEIKVLRVDTEKVDDLIAQTGELLINGIKTREHMIRIADINEKILRWNSVSKKITNYLKYLEKRGFFAQEHDESAYAFYKKAQVFFNDNADMINELNIDFNHLYNIISEDDNKLHQTVMEIETIAKSIRVLPLATIFHSFPRMIRDIAKEKNKQVDFIITGSDTTVDKKIIEEIKMPLIHILRNAVSHGIEEPKVRIQNNKNETGTIKLSAKQAENNVLITIEDDGYGINLEKIKTTAIKKGMLTKEETESMTNEQLMKLLFLPGFSTEESVSDISGRGIGLDVVKTKITNLNGEFSISSELNKGCRVTIKLPLSMSTLKAFILTVNNQKYAIPVNAIKYVKYVKNSEILYNNGTKSIIFEGHSIPLYSLSEIFEGNCKIASEDFLITVIIIEFAGKQSAFIVDKLLGDQEVFHKKLIAPIIKIKNISGFTTLSTGEICLIINPYELMRNTSSKNAQFVFEYKSNSLQDKQSALASQKTLILNDENGKLNQIKNDLSDCIDNICEFNNINSIYDYIQKNETDILICNINTLNDEAIRLIRYLKSDENYNGIKIIIFSELPEYELNEQLKDYKYSHFENILKYNKEDFINKLYEIIG